MPKVQPTGDVIDWYNAKAVARVSGLSGDMVNYLCRYDIVAPSGAARRGRGTQRKYTYTDVLLLRIIAKLLDQGISVLRLRTCLAALQERGRRTDELVSKKFVATDGYEVYFEDDKVLELLGTGQMAFAFVLELSNLRKEVLEKIADDRKVANANC